MSIWLISDEHFGHRNILKFCERPFQDIQQMEKVISGRIASVMKPEDVMYHLGDFGFGARPFMERMKEMVRSWPGTHIAIRGNHDRKHSRLMQMGFAASLDYAEINHNGLRIAMTHRPRYEKPDGVDIVLHGHVHRALTQGMIDGGENPVIPLWNVNLCVDVTQFAPVSLDYAIKMWRKQNKWKD